MNNMEKMLQVLCKHVGAETPQEPAINSNAESTGASAMGADGENDEESMDTEENL